MHHRFLVLALAAAGVATSSVYAQNVVVRGGSVLRTQVAPGAKVAVPVVIDMSGGGGANVSSLTLLMSWGPSRLTFDSLRAGSFGSLAANTSGAGAGSVTMSMFDATGTTSTVTMATAYFTASASSGGARVSFVPSVAGNDVGADVLPLFGAQALDVCVAASGLWGDVNASNTVNIIDAQQVARFSVGLAVANAAAVASQGDVTNDGNVNIIDAQQVARFSVALTAAARVNTALFVTPTVAAVAMNQGSASLNVGAVVGLISDVTDGTSASINGCVPVAWSSNSPAIATVDSAGRVSGVTTGTAIITAAAGGQTAQSTITVGPTAGPAASIQFIAGDQQWGYTSTQAPVVPQVLVRDAANVPVPNAAVTFTVSAGTLNNGAPAIVNTDVNGRATAPVWFTPASSSAATITASVGGSVQNAVATLNIVPRPLGTTTCMYDVWGNRCWGSGALGQLGNGSSASSNVPVDVSVGGSNMRLATTSAYGDHFCALDSGGAAFCWGSNAGGQLGDSTRADRNTPTPVKGGLAFQSLATGTQHTCGVTTGGDVYCWGVGSFGQLGDSTIGNSYVGARKALTPNGVAFTQVVAGLNHTCATSTIGDVYCWGDNRYGQLGDGTITAQVRSYPRLITGSTKFPQISAGSNGTCGLTAAGAAHCWGINSSGQLGNGSYANSGAPVPVQGGHAFSAITSGLGRSCGEKHQGGEFTVYCWGSNSGSLGDGTTLDRAAPTLLPVTMTGVTHSGFTGVGTACGRGRGGSQVFCWGVNGSGQLGDGTTTARIAPTLIPRAGMAPGAPLAMVPGSITMLPQSAAIGTAVAVAPTVVVRDGLGNPIAGATVSWSVLAGGGSVGASSATTDAGGVAASGGWTLGSSVGEQRLQASVSGVIVNSSAAPNLLTTFVAHATNTPASAVKISGDSTWSGTSNGGNPAVPLVVKVLDASSNPIPNVSVTYTLGANSGTFGQSATTATVQSDANGLASMVGTYWVPNNVPGTQSTVTATVSGLATPFVFTHFRAAGNFGLVSCELTNAGAAMCQGQNTYGTVGDGTTTNRTTFVPVNGGLVFSSLAEGTSMTKCGLVGTVAYCWGSNSMGQVGDGTQTDRSVPTPVSGSLAFTKLVSQGFTTCGLSTTNQLFCWGFTGANGWGEGEAMRARIHTSPTLVNTGGLTFTKIAVSDDGICGLTSAGAIHCRMRGGNGNGTSTIGTTFVQWPGGPWSDVAAGNIMICALDMAGLAYCNNTSAQGGSGTGTTASVSVPTQVLGGVSFSSIHVGNFRACARRSNGELYCWGINNGTGITSPTDGPALVAGLQVSSVRLGHFRNGCAKATSGLLYCWGPNSSAGSVGDGTTIDRATPVAIPSWPDGPASGTAVGMYTNVPNYTSIVSSTVSPAPSVTLRDRLGSPVAGVTVTFTAAANSGVVTGGSAVTDAAGIATAGSWTLPGTVGSARLIITAPGVPNAVIPASVQTPPSSITITAGNNQYLPDFYGGSTQPLSVTVLDANGAPIFGMPVTFAVASGNGTVSSGSSVIFTTSNLGVATVGTWTPPSGSGTAYALTATVPGLAPVTFTARRIADRQNGANNTTASQCRLTSAGAAYCWGGNTQGQSGDGTNTFRPVPVAVSGGLTFASLSRSWYGMHQCGLTSAGAAYCWGSNEVGQLGNGTQVQSNVPVPVAGGLTFATLATGTYSTCGLTTAGSMYCWGWGAYSFRGDGELYTLRVTPTLVNTGSRTFTSIAVGGRAICALDATGQAFCWGENFAGHLGNGTVTAATLPQPTTTSLRFTQLTAGFDVNCGVTTTNTVACWGSNTNGGGVGNGSTTVNQLTPLTVPGLSGMLEVRAGEQHMCARSAGTVHCWGQNGTGQVGDGSQVNRSTPVQVAQGIVPTSLPAGSRVLSCAASSSQMYCWGSSPGGVGDNTFNFRTVPTAVQWPETSAGLAAVIQNVTPISISASAGTPQTVTVQVRNAFGAAMPGIAMLFDVTSGGGTVSVASANSDAAGRASVDWTLAGAPGTVGTITVRISGVPTVTFTGTVGTTAGSITPTGGDNQYVLDYMNLGAHSVTVRDASNAPIAGATVTWSVTGGNGTLSQTATNTNASGVATLPANSWTIPTAIGANYTLQASVAGPAPVTFNARRMAWGSNGTSNPTHAVCRLNSSGAALCWGGNSQGQIGDGTTTNRQSPTPVSGGLTFTALAKGSLGNHNCGLTSAGQAYCWGVNEAGQLGNGSQVNSNVPVPVSGGLTFASLTTTSASTCGLTTAGAMYCWGWGGWSARGDGEIYTIRNVPTLVNTGGLTFTNVTLGTRLVCALDAGGQAFCWGENYAGQLGTGNFTYQTAPVATSTALRFSSLTAGNDHVCGLTTANTVACWGANGQGQVGNGTTVSQTTPLVLGSLSGVTEARAGETHTCARTSTNVHCWGANGGGQIGDGTFVTPRTLPLIATSGFAPSAFPSFARSTSCVTSSAQMYCWGSMNAGLGDGTGIGPRASAVAVRWPEASTLAAAALTAITPQTLTGVAASAQTVTVEARNAFGSAMSGVAIQFVVTSGGGSVSVANVTTDSSGRASTGWTLAGAVGTSGTMEARVSNVPTTIFRGTVIAGAGSLLINGGNNQYRPDFETQLNGLSVTVRDGSNALMPNTTVTWTVAGGNGTVSTSATNTNANGVATLDGWVTPTTAGTTYTLQASVAGAAPVTFTSRRIAWGSNGANNPQSSICRLNAAGAAYCWGGNNLGAVGDGTFTGRTSPTAVAGGHTFASLSGGSQGFHNCAITSAGQAYCWGNNDAGQLGNNTQVNSNTPVTVAGGLAFASIGTGPLSTCGITTAGALYCWGWGGNSFRGDGELYTIRLTPTLVNTGGRTFTSFALGVRSLCALDASGQAFCWGDNFAGQLGNGTTTNAPTPVTTSTANRFTSLGAGFDHTCGVTTTSSVMCWGYNGNGVVGNGTTVNQNTPQVAIAGSVAELRVGESHNCARVGSAVQCWGFNGSGQIGDGTTAGPRTAPVQVAAGLPATSLLSFSRAVSCATSTTQMYCWGGNPSGIGDGTGATRSVATAVRWVDALTTDPAMTFAVTQASFAAAAGAPQTVTIQVRNATGAPLSAVSVAFVVASGGGSVSTVNVTTDASGNATTSWTLAGTAGTVGKLEARVAGLPHLVITGTVQ